MEQPLRDAHRTREPVAPADGCNTNVDTSAVLAAQALSPQRTLLRRGKSHEAMRAPVASVTTRANRISCSITQLGCGFCSSIIYLASRHSRSVWVAEPPAVPAPMMMNVWSATVHSPCLESMRVIVRRR